MVDGKRSPDSLIAEQLQRSNRWHYREKVILLDVLKERFGPDVVSVVDEVVAERARKFGSMIALRNGSNKLEDIPRLLWEPGILEGMEYRVSEADNGLQFICTRCTLYDLAIELNATEWMYHLVCAADPYIIEGYNSRIGFRRTKTLMQGDSYCDHFYYWKDP